MLGRGCLKILCWQRCFAGDGALLAKMSLDVIHIRIELTVNVNAPALFNLTSQGTSRDKIFFPREEKKLTPRHPQISRFSCLSITVKKGVNVNC